MNKKLKLIVFDWDGTLMNSVDAIVNSMAKALADVGLPKMSAQEMSGVIGLGLTEAIAALIPDCPEEKQQQVISRYRYHFMDKKAAPIPMFDGADAVVSQLHGQGYKLAIATGKGRTGLDHVLSHVECADLFHTSRCAGEVSSKPHPEMLNEIMYEMKVEPEQTLMVGDSVYDLEMAKNAGAHALGVTYGVHSRTMLLQQQPLACIDDVNDIPSWIANNFTTAP